MAIVEKVIAYGEGLACAYIKHQLSLHEIPCRFTFHTRDMRHEDCRAGPDTRHSHLVFVCVCVCVFD